MTMGRMTQQEVFESIIIERMKQDEKWGPQKHSLSQWLMILSEEIGEFSAAVLEKRFLTEECLNYDWRREAIQMAAVIVAMLEYSDEEIPF